MNTRSGVRGQQRTDVPYEAALKRIRRENKTVLQGLRNKQAGTREGFVYVITNPAWPGYVKVGRALDPFDRLASYQTSDPNRAFNLEVYRYFSDRYDGERIMQRLLTPWWASGEWYKVPLQDALDLLEGIHT